MVARRAAAKATHTGADDRLLIEAAQKDPRRFGDLYELNFERVYAFIVSRIHDRDAAQDLTSDVFHKALSSISRFEWRGVPFSAWLLRIAANAIADRSKRGAREVLSPDDPPEPTVEIDMTAVEHRARLFQLVGELPTDQRYVIFQRFVEQRSIREIAQRLGRSEGAVKQLQFRALEKLRSQMEGANG
jgi:RNA polymerase sigma-70 factor, ECF subfamily